MEETGADEHGSSLVKLIGTRLAELLYKAQKHNKIRQRVAMGSDECSKEYAARSRSSSVRN